MRHLDYSVIIQPGTEMGDGRVGTQHGVQYTIRMGNGHNTACDARVSIDGKEIGTFRIGGHGSVLLERPPESTGRFTFFRLGTEEGNAAGLVDSEKAGLISVKFTPEVRREVYRGGGSGVMRGLSMGGGTGLTGHSNQGFVGVSALELNHAEAVVIHLRLVPAPENDIRPLLGISRETPIPSR